MENGSCNRKILRSSGMLRRLVSTYWISPTQLHTCTIKHSLYWLILLLISMQISPTQVRVYQFFVSMIIYLVVNPASNSLPLCIFTWHNLYYRGHSLAVKLSLLVHIHDVDFNCLPSLASFNTKIKPASVSIFIRRSFAVWTGPNFILIVALLGRDGPFAFLGLWFDACWLYQLNFW